MATMILLHEDPSCCFITRNFAEEAIGLSSQSPDFVLPTIPSEGLLRLPMKTPLFSTTHQQTLFQVRLEHLEDF